MRAPLKNLEKKVQQALRHQKSCARYLHSILWNADCYSFGVLTSHRWYRALEEFQTCTHKLMSEKCGDKVAQYVEKNIMTPLSKLEAYRDCERIREQEKGNVCGSIRTLTKCRCNCSAILFFSRMCARKYRRVCQIRRAAQERSVDLGRLQKRNRHWDYMLVSVIASRSILPMQITAKAVFLLVKGITTSRCPASRITRTDVPKTKTRRFTTRPWRWSRRLSTSTATMKWPKVGVRPLKADVNNWSFVCLPPKNLDWANTLY